MPLWGMFFILSKLFWHLAAPSHVLALLILATALCLVLRWRRPAWIFGVLTILILLTAGVSPLPLMAVQSLENQYPRPPWPAHVDGVLMLGAGFDTGLLRTRHAPQTNIGAYRLVEGYAAARHYPDARVVFSGGSGALRGARFSEAETARTVLEEMGLDPKRLVLEAHSRNTYENIVFTKQIVKPKPGQVWLLATSAIHMPRAMAIARKQGWPMLPWPTDYFTSPTSRGDWLFVADNLGLADYAVHEWIGMFAYRLTGKAQ
jgi:uncharacterized SAM-binding protein YcdF (DUF218 family)